MLVKVINSGDFCCCFNVLVVIIFSQYDLLKYGCIEGLFISWFMVNCRGNFFFFINRFYSFF